MKTKVFPTNSNIFVKRLEAVALAELQKTLLNLEQVILDRLERQNLGVIVRRCRHDRDLELPGSSHGFDRGQRFGRRRRGSRAAGGSGSRSGR